MFFIETFADIGTQSFRIADRYLGKKAKNIFIGWDWEISYTKKICKR